MNYDDDFEDFLSSNTPRASVHPEKPVILKSVRSDAVVDDRFVGSSDNNVAATVSEAVIFSFTQKRSTGIPVSTSASHSLKSDNYKVQ